MRRSSWPGGSHGELAAETYVWLSGTHTRTRRPERWFDAVVLSELWRARQSAARALSSTGMGLLRGVGAGGGGRRVPGAVEPPVPKHLARRGEGEHVQVPERPGVGSDLRGAERQ